MASVFIETPIYPTTSLIICVLCRLIRSSIEDTRAVCCHSLNITIGLAFIKRSAIREMTKKMLCSRLMVYKTMLQLIS